MNEVLNLSDDRKRPIPTLTGRAGVVEVEEFGWTLGQPGGASVLVDFSVAPLVDHAGQRTGTVITLRNAGERLRSQAIEETLDDGHSFDSAPMAMVQLDNEGRIVRVNKALVQESGVEAECLLGRSLTGLSMDPDPRIAKQLMHKLLQQGGTAVTTARPRVLN